MLINVKLNIENMFSKFKNYTERRPRVKRKDILGLIQVARNTTSSDNCRVWVKHATDNFKECMRYNVIFDNLNLFVISAPLLGIEQLCRDLFGN